MGLLDKLKNMFTEEEIEENEPIKKEVFQVEIPAPNIEEKEDIEEEIKKEPIKKEEPTKREEKFVFPVYFDDADFDDEPKKEKVKPVIPEKKIAPVKKPEVKKTFKPSPVISPVYGVLDKNYSKEDITSKDGLLNDSEDKIDIDYVIKKAYGSDTTLKEENKEEDTKIDLFKEEEIKSEDVNVTELDEKIKSIDDLLKDTSDDDFYSLVDSMYKDSEVDE